MYDLGIHHFYVVVVLRENSLSVRKYTDTHSMHNNIFSCVVRIVVGDGDDDSSGSSGERKKGKQSVGPEETTS